MQCFFFYFVVLAYICDKFSGLVKVYDFYSRKNDYFRLKNSLFFIFSVTIRKKHTPVTPCNPQFYYVKVGCEVYELHGNVIMISYTEHGDTGIFQRHLATCCQNGVYK